MAQFHPSTAYSGAQVPPAGVIGDSGGNLRAVLIPEPVDYTTFTQVNHNKEDTWKIGLRRSLMEDLSGAVSFSRAQRNGSKYEDVPYLESYSPQFTTPQQPYAFDDHPYLRKFMYADRDREKTSFSLMASPGPLGTLQARVDFIKDDYINSRATGKINTATGSALTTVGIPLPDITSRMESVQLTGKYKVRKDLTVKLSITHQRLSTVDWAYDNLVPATIPNVITTGQVSPNYSVNVIGLSLLYWF